MPTGPVPANIPSPPLRVPTPGVPLQDVPEGQGKGPCTAHFPEHNNLLSILHSSGSPLSLSQMSPMLLLTLPRQLPS